MKKKVEIRVTGDGGGDARKPVWFRRTVWKGGRMNYECALCPYATLDAVGMAGHLRTVHGLNAGGAATAESDGTPIILIQEDEVKE